MEATDLLRDAIERVRDLVHTTARGLDTEQLARRPMDRGNSIGWLLWHLTRIQDDHVAGMIDEQQLWVTGGHATALGFEPDPGDHGYGQTPAEAAAVRISDPARLVGYHDAVAARSLESLAATSAADFDSVVDTDYDPPVTAGVRWVSLVSDCIQHVGQAAYARGLLEL